MNQKEVGYWVAAGRWPRLFGTPLDARAGLPLPLVLFAPSTTTLLIAITTVIAFGVLSARGFTFQTMFRATRRTLRGRRVYARPWHYTKRFRSQPAI